MGRGISQGRVSRVSVNDLANSMQTTGFRFGPGLPEKSKTWSVARLGFEDQMHSAGLVEVGPKRTFDCFQAERCSSTVKRKFATNGTQFCWSASLQICLQCAVC